MFLIRRPTPVAIGLILFASGVGCGLFQPLLGGMAVGLAGCLALAGRIGWAALVVMLLGLGHGVMARRLDRERCAAALEPGVYRGTVRLLEPAIPDRAVPVVLGDRCRGTVTLKQRARDTLWAGSVIAVEARWVPRPSRWRPADGLLVVRSVERTLPSRPTFAERLRNGIVATIHRLYGPRAGMIEALALGSRGTIAPTLSQSFARSGLVHLLSISGFHVGLVWAWVVLVLRATRWRRHAATVAAVIVVAYVLFIGAPAPALRAALLAIIGAIEVARQRLVATGALAALVAWLVVMADPWTVTDIGAWLSVSALWGASAASRWGEEVLGRGPVWAVLVSSVGATLATAPVSALAFGSVSLIGVVLNIIAIPSAALALPAVLGGLLVAPVWTAPAAALAAGGGMLLGALEWLADRGSMVPGAALSFEPGIWPAAVAVGVVILAVGIFGRRNRLVEVQRRVAWTAAVTLVGSLGFGLADRPHQASGLTLHFLAVGQGDAALIQTKQGHWVLVDAGPRDQRTDAGARVIVPFLIRHGVRRLAAVVLSHAHLDHFGGLAAIVDRIPVDLVVEPGVATADARYLELLDQLDDNAVPWRSLQAGDRLTVDEVTLRVLHPDPRWDGYGEDLNENSVVLALEAGGFDAILAGDAGFPAEERLAPALGSVEVLKVGHHGSRWATGASWLARLRPEVAVVSVGVNRYGHPSPEAMGRLEAAHVAVFRTDRDGTVDVVVGEREFSVTSRRGTLRYPLHP